MAWKANDEGQSGPQNLVEYVACSQCYPEAQGHQESEGRDQGHRSTEAQLLGNGYEDEVGCGPRE